jgi:hypothetical protein
MDHRDDPIVQEVWIQRLLTHQNHKQLVTYQIQLYLDIGARTKAKACVVVRARTVQCCR